MPTGPGLRGFQLWLCCIYRAWSQQPKWSGTFWFPHVLTSSPQAGAANIFVSPRIKPRVGKSLSSPGPQRVSCRSGLPSQVCLSILGLCTLGLLQLEASLGSTVMPCTKTIPRLPTHPSVLHSFAHPSTIRPSTHEFPTSIFHPSTYPPFHPFFTHPPINDPLHSLLSLNIWQKQHKEGRVHFGSHLEDKVSHGGEGM